MRTLIFLLLLLTPALPAADLTRDDLMGHWKLDEAAVSEDQQDAAKAAKQVEMFGLLLTNRVGKAVWSNDEVTHGMWRLDNSSETGGTVVIQSRGSADETRLTVTVTPDEKDPTITRMTIAEQPHKLPLIRIR